MRLKHIYLSALVAISCVGCSDLVRESDADPSPDVGPDAIDSDTDDVPRDGSDRDGDASIGLRLRPESIRLAVGAELQVEAFDAQHVRLDIGAVELETSDPTVASVSPDGTVRAIASGSFELTGRFEGATAHVAGEVVAPAWTDVDVAAHKTCALSGDGRVSCAGAYESDPEFEGGARRPQGELRALDHEATFTELAVNSETICALDDSGRPWCRGSGFTLSIGGDEVVDADEFLPLETPEDVVLTGLDSGREHFCTVSTAGGVWCWGDNGSNQLGRYGSGAPDRARVFVEMVSVAAGEDHSCALSADGIAYCWGENSSGQLGRESQSQPRMPAATTFTERFDKLAAGAYHSCGLSDSQVYCWGNNFSNQLGFEPAPGRSQGPPGSLQLAGTTNAAAIAADGSSSCSLSPRGTAVCWGDNEHGQLANHEMSPHQLPTTIEGTAFTKLAISSTHSCAVTLAGELRCWGFDAGGALGVGRQVSFTEPKLVDTFGGALDAGSRHTCRVRDQKLECWGSNLKNQYGNRSTRARSRAVLAVEGMQSVAAGANASCGVLDDALHCWGEGPLGEFGRRMARSDVPAETGFDGVPDLLQMTEGSVMARESGQTYWWGAYQSMAPVHAVLDGSADADATDVGLDAPSVGGQHGCGIRRGSDGVVHCWGDRDYRGDPDQRSTETHVAYPIATDKRFDDVAAGKSHACALATDDTLHCWGSVVPRAGHLEAPTDVAGAIKLETLFGGGSHFGCGLDADGKAYCWGKNVAGALGDGTTSDRAVPTAVAGGHTFRELTLGASHVCGVTTDDEVYCWGANGYGQLGIGGQLYRLSPEPVVTEQ